MKKALIAITIMIVSLCATMALADTKVYPDFMGVRWSAAEPNPIENWGAIENPSTTQGLRINLPVIHDGQAVHRINSGWVKVADMH